MARGFGVKLLALCKGLAKFVGAGIGLALFLMLAARVVRPDLGEPPPAHGAEELRKAEKARDMSIDPENPLVLYREVDYSEGKAGAWYPKGESPILAELVGDGKLPPVAERVGNEPFVIEGIDGIGKYGGTWFQADSSEMHIGYVATGRIGNAKLVSWSPHGYPIVPYLAKSYEVSPDNREFTFTLRKGVRWSDGHPYTADDIMFWWEHVVNEPAVTGAFDQVLQSQIIEVHGKMGTIEKLDSYTVRFSFPEPYGLFVARAAGPMGAALIGLPAHYLAQFHPVIGNKGLIAETMKARNLESPLAVYLDAADSWNPDLPTLSPWAYRTYRATAPHAFVRNPYYWAVDPEGNQLPYIDRILFDVRADEMISVAASQGELTMQDVQYKDYTLLLSNQDASGYEVRHWYYCGRNAYVISVNLNRRIDPGRPETKLKHELLNDKRFRKALSLAINRQDIINAEYHGQTKPAQVAPGRESFFYEPGLEERYAQYDPETANRVLDEIGLTQRDYEGMRTFRDGSRMTFFLSMVRWSSVGIAEFIVDDWRDVGIRAIAQQRSRQLFYTEKSALRHDFTVWGSSDESIPVLDPRCFVPWSHESNYAIGFAKWYQRGGLYGDPRATGPGCIEPPEDHPLRRAMEVFDATLGESDPAKQRRVFREVLEIAAENVWTIGICTSTPNVFVVKKGVRNVPDTAVTGWQLGSPGNAGPMTFFFDNPQDSPGAVAEIKRSMIETVPRPRTVSTEVAMGDRGDGGLGGRAVRRLLLVMLFLAACLVGVKHPYVGRRLLIMVPTLFIMSVITFIIIQLPPGDYLTARIMELEEKGETANLQQLEELKRLFHLEEPLYVQYAYWLGLPWFTTFDPKDKGLLQGHLGRSMENNRVVNDIVGDRILLTFLISLGTILFTWVAALPIGIYSAVKQYSPGDYALTLIGFIGMCIPSFLLALVLMHFSWTVLGINVTGLFSAEYATQPEWTWGKVVDLLKHIWLPIVVVGVGGTAGMIRVMRGNLLDELRKPYVVTAMAKGLRPIRLLLKYPVRLAVNPFISGIGGILPGLVSGNAIVAMVLSLPTVGPLLLDALMSEDMYMAGSMLMVLSLLAVLGTLVSDLLLLWLDPRIRFETGTR